MKDEKCAGENVPNLPSDIDDPEKELDSMSVEELKEELGILWDEMDEDSFDGELLEEYLNAIESKEPLPKLMDKDKAYKLILKRSKERAASGKVRRNVLKSCVIAAAIIALLVASMVVVNAAGTDIFKLIARWTAETFGFVKERMDNTDDVPAQLEEMRETLAEKELTTDYLPTYWPEGFEQTQIMSKDGTESYYVVCVFGDKEDNIVLSYTMHYSDNIKTLFNIDEDNPEVYVHNGIRFYIMTNNGKYLAACKLSDKVELRISELKSYEELLKILDSIGG